MKCIQNSGNPQQKTAKLAEKYRHSSFCLVTIPASQTLATVTSRLIAMFEVPARKYCPGRRYSS